MLHEIGLQNVSVAIFVSSLSGILWLLVIREKDTVEPEPLRVMVRLLLVGGICSIIFSSFLYLPFLAIVPGFAEFSSNHGIFLRGDDILFPLFSYAAIIGMVEECAKALAAMILTSNLKEFDEPLDGMIYGMSVALGFAVFENTGYLIEDPFNIMAVRFFFALPLHISCGAIWGYGLALNRFKHQQVFSFRYMFPFVLAAAFLHAVYDFACLFYLEQPLVMMILLTLITIVAYRWSFLQTRKLAAASPFLRPGECPGCRTIACQGDKVCAKCGRELSDREISYSEETPKGPMSGRSDQKT